MEREKLDLLLIEYRISQNLAVNNCTASSNEVNHLFAMLIKYSSNLLIKNVCFQNCSVTALFMINNTGEISLDNTSFVHNHPKYRQSKVRTSHPGALGIQLNLEESNQTVNIKVTNSIFHYNQSPEIKNVSVLGNSPASFLDRGYGGAMFVEFGGTTCNSSLVIEGTKFTYNTAARGGAVYAYYKDRARNNSIHIMHTKFLGNNADISGGGLNLGCYNSPSTLNVFEVTDCKIIKNTALYGAGLTLYSV